MVVRRLDSRRSLESSLPVIKEGERAPFLNSG